MNYNIHPIFVHFPIAFLFVYSIIKILPLKYWFPHVTWKHIERVLLLVGVIGAFAALYTGQIAEHLVNPNHQLVEMHSTFAASSAWIYSALLLGEIAALINSHQSSSNTSKNIFLLLFAWIEKVLCNYFVALILAIIGLMYISLTGLLGGVLAYGTSSDPVAPLILKLLGINL